MEVVKKNERKYEVLEALCEHYGLGAGIFDKITDFLLMEYVDSVREGYVPLMYNIDLMDRGHGFSVRRGGKMILDRRRIVTRRYPIRDIDPEKPIKIFVLDDPDDDYDDDGHHLYTILSNREVYTVDNELIDPDKFLLCVFNRHREGIKLLKREAYEYYKREGVGIDILEEALIRRGI